MLLRSSLSAQSVPLSAGASTAQLWGRHCLDMEMGCLGMLGGNATLDDGMVPVIHAWCSNELLGLDFANTSEDFIRSRFCLLGQWIEAWPANHDLGLMGSAGQDLSLNEFAHVGGVDTTHEIQDVDVAVSFQQSSDGVAKVPNLGGKSLGFTVGLSWGF